MLKKKYKIKKEFFPEIISKGKIFYSPHISLRILQNKKTEHAIFSFTVSAKVARSAVARNLLKRRGFAVVKKIFKNTKQSPAAYAFFFKKGADKISYAELEKEIVTLQKTSDERVSRK